MECKHDGVLLREDGADYRHSTSSPSPEIVVAALLAAHREARRVIRGVNELLEAMSDSLTDKERDVLFARFGIGRRDWALLSELAPHFATTRERVRQIEARAIRKVANDRRWGWKRVRVRVDSILCQRMSNAEK